MNQTSPRNSPATPDEIDLFELFHALWRQKKLIMGCTPLPRSVSKSALI
ncbi:Wzz/FepE/Etk N-terminal domain-containing protein [Pseudomonas sp. M5A4_2d]